MIPASAQGWLTAALIIVLLGINPVIQEHCFQCLTLLQSYIDVKLWLKLSASCAFGGLSVSLYHRFITPSPWSRLAEADKVETGAHEPDGISSGPDGVTVQFKAKVGVEPANDTLQLDIRNEKEFQVLDDRFAFAPAVLSTNPNQKDLPVGKAIEGLEGVYEGGTTSLFFDAAGRVAPSESPSQSKAATSVVKGGFESEEDSDYDRGSEETSPRPLMEHKPGPDSPIPLHPGTHVSDTISPDVESDDKNESEKENDPDAEEKSWLPMPMDVLVAACRDPNISGKDLEAVLKAVDAMIDTQRAELALVSQRVTLLSIAEGMHHTAQAQDYFAGASDRTLDEKTLHANGLYKKECDALEGRIELVKAMHTDLDDGAYKMSSGYIDKFKETFSSWDKGDAESIIARNDVQFSGTPTCEEDINPQELIQPSASTSQPVKADTTISYTANTQKKRRQEKRARKSAKRLRKPPEEFKDEVEALMQLRNVDRDRAIKMLILHDGDWDKAWDEAIRRYTGNDEADSDTAWKIEDHDSIDIELIVAQVRDSQGNQKGVGFLEAVKALQAAGGDIVEAVMELSSEWLIALAM